MNSGNLDSGICRPYNHFAVEKVGGSCSHLGAIGPRVSGALALWLQRPCRRPEMGPRPGPATATPRGGGRQNTNFPGLISPNVYWNLNIKKIRAAQGGSLNRGAPCHGIIGILVNPALFKVTNFGTNRKPICDFLLVVNSNLPPILYRFLVMADYWSDFCYRHESASL